MAQLACAGLASMRTVFDPGPCNKARCGEVLGLKRPESLGHSGHLL